MYKSYCNAHYYLEWCRKRLKMEIDVKVLGDFLILCAYTVQNYATSISNRVLQVIRFWTLTNCKITIDIIS